MKYFFSKKSHKRKLEKKLTDKEFISYLAEKYLNSGDDCCKVCAYSSMTDLCDNLKQNEEADEKICLKGFREFADRAKQN